MKQLTGFTTVELMVTLFVAVLFILTGYQLYGAINLNTNNTRAMAEASNIAYDVLRNEGSVYQSTTALCTSPAIDTSVTRDSKIQNMSIEVARCSPPLSISNITIVTVTVKYGDPQKEVKHATYVMP